MRLLWLKSDLLHPVDRGGRIRTYQIVRQLARDHEITYLALDDGTTDPDAESLASEYATKVRVVPYRRARRGTPRFYWELFANLFSSLPYSLSRYRVRGYAHAVEELASEVDLVVCDFLTPAVNLQLPLAVPAVLFQHNVEAEIWRRHTHVRRGLQHWYFGLQWKRMLRFEAQACRHFDHVIAVSDDDRRHFESNYGVARVSSVGTGVDLEFFRASDTGPRSAHEVVFVGSLDWMPNSEGMLWFVEHVWPRITQAVPEASLTIVGRDPPQSIRELEGRPGIQVTGRVDDVRPYLERAALSVVPLHVGGGTRLKIFEAMAMGCPVVSTTIGAEGLPLVHDEHVLLADSSGEFAGACVSLLQDPSRRHLLAADASRTIRQRFGWDGVAREFAKICQATLDGVHPRPISQ